MVEEVKELITFWPQFTTMILVFGIICIVMYKAKKTFDSSDPLKINSGFQNLIEWLFEYFEEMTESMLGKERVEEFTPLTTTMFISIMVSNMAGLFFMTESAFANPIYTFTWSMSMFVFWSVYAIYKTGVFSFLKNALVGEYVALAPIETMGYLVKPISMGARLLGNISAGTVFIMLILILPDIPLSFVTENSGAVAQVALPIFSVILMLFSGVLAGFAQVYFSVLGPFIQATVFTYLTLASISALLPEEEE